MKISFWKKLRHLFSSHACTTNSTTTQSRYNMKKWNYKRIFSVLAGLILAGAGFLFGSERIPIEASPLMFFLSAIMAGIGTSILICVHTES